MTQQPGRPSGPEPDPGRQAPNRDAAITETVRPGGRGRGVTIAAALIVLAFLVGLVRPWDLFTGGAEAVRPGIDGGSAAVADPGAGTPDGTDPGDATPAPPTPATGAAAATCGYPQGWRSATIQRWAGRRARVWSAVDVAQASGPTDPAIGFQVVAGDDFTALGWCAPVTGDDRPPLAAQGHLFRIAADGSASELMYRRLEPTDPSALGELWIPVEAGETAWPPGRYVIELTTPSGTWRRWLGLELRSQPVVPPGSAASPSGSPSPGASGAPSASPSPPAQA